MPAYNAARTLRRTYDEIPQAVVDAVILVDDGGTDETSVLSATMGIPTFRHEVNLGYGRNSEELLQGSARRRR
jgi:glycosyltransferase involved in cell wall biosynthesis